MSISPATTGWRGVILCTDPAIGSDGALRFTNESVDVPIEVSVDTELHSGVRTPSVFQFGIVKPSGSINFPFLEDAPYIDINGDDLSLSSGTKAVLNRAIQPNSTATAAYPILDADTITVYRGDIKKVLYEPWINTISLTGSAGSKIDIALGLKCVYGEVVKQSDPNEALSVLSFPKSRAITFNEMNWDLFRTNIAEVLELDPTSVPQTFTLTVNNGILDDDTPNTSLDTRIKRIRAIRGFALGYMSITFDITFVGRALPWVNGTGLSTQYTLPTSSQIDIAGIYKLSGGIITTRTANIPGNNNLSTTQIMITGMLAGADLLDYPIEPGTLIL